MKNLQNIIVTITIVSVTTIVGCGDKSKPSDLPALSPCTITIMQEEKPLAGASVEFVPVDAATVKYRAMSITGADGSVKMSTYGFSGVPAGKYKIVITKNVDEALEYGLNSAGEREVKTYKTYRTIEEKYSSPETTPHELEITGKEKNVTKTFDIGKAVKVREAQAPF